MALSRVGACVLGAVALCVSGCGDSHDAVARDMLSAQQEIRVIVAGVQDDATAEAAVAQLATLADKIQAIQRRSEVLGSAPAEVATALRARYSQDFETTAELLRQDLAKMDPQHALRLQDAVGQIVAASGQ